MLGGPRPRLEELVRLFRISWEFLRGFRRLHFVPPCVTVFGSARFVENNRWYQLARRVGSELGRRGFSVMTGGGPGIMEAANRGAREVGALSIGCNIILPHEQVQNAYCDTIVSFRHFFIRKVMLVKYSYGFVVMPGGFGTLDEFFEAITLVQTKKIADFPIVLMGCEYWQQLFAFIDQRLVPDGTISPGDNRLYRVTDDPVEAADYITETARKRFGLRYGMRARRRWWLFE
jgi:uncharacterized protein (TIGR00730 family)